MKFDFTKAQVLSPTEAVVYEHALGDIKLQEFLNKVKEKKELYKIKLIVDYLEDLKSSELAALRDGEVELINSFLKEA